MATGRLRIRALRPRAAASRGRSRLTLPGAGIDPQYHGKVFGLFERLEPEASEGTGIGLALVKRIVEVHGGRIWVESEGAGRGSTFCFALARLALRVSDDSGS